MAIGNLGLGLGGYQPHDPSAISSQCNVLCTAEGELILIKHSCFITFT